MKGRRQTWRTLTTTVFVFPFSFGLFYLHFTSFFVCLGAGTPIPKGYIVQQEKKKDERESSAHRRIAASLEWGLKGQTKQSKRRKKGDIIR